jgi:hypothetical protein
MSGGHWDYQEHQVRDLLERVAEDTQVKARFPSLAVELAATATILHEIIHALDYDLSGDTSIQDDTAFEKQALRKLCSPLRGR